MAHSAHSLHVKESPKELFMYSYNGISLLYKTSEPFLIADILMQKSQANQSLEAQISTLILGAPFSSFTNKCSIK